MTGNLIEPFSPYATALRNIRDNLVAKQERITLRHLQEEYLLATITLSIPAATAPHSFLEFPAAACWVSGRPDKTIEIHYSGEYARVEEVNGGKEWGKIEAIQNNIEKRINKIIDDGKDKGLFEEFAFEGERTDYPESLRSIKGYRLFRVETCRSEVSFLVFLSHRSTDMPGQAPDAVSYDSLMENVSGPLEAFFSAIRELEYLVEVEEGNKETYGVQDSVTSRRRDPNLSYPILRDILSGIVIELDKLRRNKSFTAPKSDANSDGSNLSDIFRIVFVRPVVLGQGHELGFRYILTHQQLTYLEGQGVERIDNLVGEGEKAACRQLSKEFQELRKSLSGAAGILHASGFGTLEEIDGCENLGFIIKAFAREELYKKSGVAEEFLRKCIYVYYAFSKESRDDLYSRRHNLLEALEEGPGDVTSEQAFLIAKIFDSRRPDVIRNFINHPFAKYLQHTTEKLIEIFNTNFAGGSFYPRFLHLFETLALPKRLFMYPIYQHDSPLILSACDANYYAPIQTNFKSILDRNTQGIFSSILGFELAETSRLLAEKVKRMPSSGEMLDFVLSELIEQRFRNLTLHFCLTPVDIKKAEIKTDITDITANEVKKTAEGVVSHLDDRGAEVTIPGLGSRIRINMPDEGEGRGFITTSGDSRSVFRLYLLLTANIFSRFFEIQNHIADKARYQGALQQRQDQYEIQAHEIKKVTVAIADGTPGYVLDQIRIYFNTLFGIAVGVFVEQDKSGFPPEYAAGNTLGDFVRNAMKVAARIEAVVSWADRGVVQHEEKELDDAAREGVERLDLDASLDALKIKEGASEANKWAFFAALVCGLRNIIKHSIRSSAVRVSLGDSDNSVVMRNEGMRPVTRGGGQKIRRRVSPGHTKEAIEFYLTLYNPDETRKVAMDWEDAVSDAYVTTIPYPKSIFVMSK